jgi:hypothetical protein
VGSTALTRALVAICGWFVVLAVVSVLAFGVQWTVQNRFVILAASLGLGAAVVVQRRLFARLR